ncbi:hypothetical protein SPRG_15996 [Saprolegnia parasitica CBS 223.65]|uniref:SMP-30/Gluconolactonase/LRE-like region domain-containing protein n=1 Tax=Saprolegnia parasitica (strain CBS 223.65) TaxID=695850 RepID=A0A067BPG6_SAPPC|nr:hypothetical protein SPRG_15996 [Saprolegnia parasitica CBS 223.65]KDO18650.1 hypothetical protein SPRG_15996 [Saprolegnia parasitica CBS 223.65]|eukprot:XP_012210636.1 hypothetical protein SPRG_15996 [Saprolegnia parasitica CBS 223.65]
MATATALTRDNSVPQVAVPSPLPPPDAEDLDAVAVEISPPDAPPPLETPSDSSGHLDLGANYGSLRVFLRLVQVSAPMRLQLLNDAAKDLASTHDLGYYHGNVSCAAIGVFDAVGGGYKASLSGHRDVPIEDELSLADAQAADVCAFGGCLIEAYRGVVEAAMDDDRRPDTMPVDLWTLARELRQSGSEQRSMTAVVGALTTLDQQTQASTAVRLDDAAAKSKNVDGTVQTKHRGVKGWGVLMGLLLVVLVTTALCVVLIPSWGNATADAGTGNSTSTPTPTPTSTPTPSPSSMPLANRSYNVSTFAGNSLITSFVYPPFGIAGNGTHLYVADTPTTIMRINTNTSSWTTFAGGFSSGFTDGAGSSATFNGIQGLAHTTRSGSAGILYVADSDNNAVRAVDANGVVTTVAGTGVMGDADGSASTATFYMPKSIAVANSTILVADTYNYKLRSINGSVVSTFSGSGVSGQASGPLPTYAFPYALAMAPSGVVYATDGNMVRKIALDGSVTNIGSSTAGHSDGSGASAAFDTPTGVAVDVDGTVYVVDTGNHCIRAIDANDNVITIAGIPGSNGMQDGAGSAAMFSGPQFIYIDPDGVLYVTDSMNFSIRRLVYT